MKTFRIMKGLKNEDIQDHEQRVKESRHPGS